MPIRVVVAEDNYLVREAVTRLLDADPDIVVAGVAEDFDGLLAAVGMAGGEEDGRVGLPESMAEINALLDLASPELREALLVAFLDRLTRPVRGTVGEGPRP